MDAESPQRPPAVQRYVWVMRLLGLTYAAVGLVFFFYPTELIYVLNTGPNVLKLAEAVPNPSEHFWLSLAVAMMAMLTVTAFLSASAPRNNGYPFIHLVSKITSVTGFTYFYIHDHRYFAYLCGALTDASIAVLLIVLWTGAQWSARRAKSAEPSAPASTSEPTPSNGQDVFSP